DFLILQQVPGRKKENLPLALFILIAIRRCANGNNAIRTILQGEYVWVLQAFRVHRAIFIVRRLCKQYAGIMVESFILNAILAESQVHAVRKPLGIDHVVLWLSRIAQDIVITHFKRLQIKSYSTYTCRNLFIYILIP